jgi:hypothetical protein
VLSSLRYTGPGDPGKTAKEIAKESGLRIERVREWIEAQLEAGRQVCGWRPKKGIDGRNTRTPVYRIKEKP